MSSKNHHRYPQVVKQLIYPLKAFLTDYITPFFTCIFTVQNYFSLTKGLEGTAFDIMFLSVSIIYFFMTLSLAVYQSTNANKI